MKGIDFFKKVAADFLIKIKKKLKQANLAIECILYNGLLLCIQSGKNDLKSAITSADKFIKSAAHKYTITGFRNQGCLFLIVNNINNGISVAQTSDQFKIS